MRKLRSNKRKFIAMGLAAGMSAAIMAGSSTAAFAAEPSNENRAAIEQSVVDDISQNPTTITMTEENGIGVQGQQRAPFEMGQNSQMQQGVPFGMGQRPENIQQAEGGAEKAGTTPSDVKPQTNAEGEQAPTQNADKQAEGVQKADGVVVPAQNGQTTEQNSQKQAENMQAPAQDGERPEGNTGAPAQDGERPEGNTGAPAQNGARPEGDTQGKVQSDPIVKKLVDDLFEIIEKNKDAIDLPEEFMNKLNELKERLDGKQTEAEKPAEGEKPEGEKTGEKSADVPELPSGEKPAEGEKPAAMPAMPGNSQEKRDMPTGFDPLVSRIAPNTNVQQGQRPEGNTGSNTGTNTQSGQRPEGNTGSNTGTSTQPGQRPEGDTGSNSSSQHGERPENNSGAPGENNSQPGGKPGEGGMSSAPTEYTAANKVSADSTGGSFTSSAANENALLADGTKATLSDITVDKTGDASGEDADFYGINAAVLASNGSDLTIKNANVTTNGTHANGVFSYGSGTTVNISDSSITTTGNNSGGLMTTGGATLNASNLTVNTSGNSSAAIRSDRGGGTVSVSEGTYKSTGKGSPAIYSTADISVSDATLEATNSEAVVIEGGNSVTLKNADITGNNAKLNGQSTTKTNVLIYQSMSGDASEGSSTFTMEDGTMTALTGSMFHVTNVTTTINLKNTTLKLADDSNDLLIASKDSWGSSGKNGGNVTMNLDSQKAEGNITVDSISSLKLNIKASSVYTGAINTTGAAGTVNVTIESGSKWVLTGDSYVTSLDGDTSGIDLNGHKLYVNGVLYNG